MSYVFLDLETTGLDADTCHITEIGAIRVNEYGDVIGQFDTYVRLPEGEKIPEDISRFTGITDDDLETYGITSESAMAQLERFIGDEGIVVAQHAPFDISFIEKHFEVKNFFDTRTLAYALDLPKANLKGLAEHYGIDMGTHHRAYSDAKTCGEIFFKQLEDLGSRAHEYLNVVGVKPERVPKKYPKNTIAVVEFGDKKEGE